jgi:hypothetical protein
MSDIQIDRDGVWFYRGMEMSREDIVRFFYRHLKKNNSGRYFIEIGQMHYAVDVEDTAYVVQAVRRVDTGNPAEESIQLYLSDGSIEELDPETLRISEENVPYCKIRDGSFDARFSLSSYHQLAEHIQYDSTCNVYYIHLRGKPYNIPGT